MPSAKCGSCGAVHQPPNIPSQCPECGSTAFSIADTDRVRLLETVRIRRRRPGYKKPISEHVQGADWSVKLRRHVHKTRTIDRLNDWYEEKVIDPETGEVLRDCAEPLSQHCNHGSAKPRLADRAFCPMNARPPKRAIGPLPR